jgi:hypothetical protein
MEIQRFSAEAFSGLSINYLVGTPPILKARRSLFRTCATEDFGELNSSHGLSAARL